MKQEEIIAKINAAESKDDLDALREVTAKAMINGSQEGFSLIQKAFRKRKNQLRRMGK